MARFLALSLAIVLLAPGLAAAQATSEPSPADISSSIATARAQIARYRLTPPPSPEDRCFDLKQIVRSLRAGRKTAEQAEWHERMRQTCTAAHRPAEL